MADHRRVFWFGHGKIAKFVKKFLADWATGNPLGFRKRADTIATDGDIVPSPFATIDDFCGRVRIRSWSTSVSSFKALLVTFVRRAMFDNRPD